MGSKTRNEDFIEQMFVANTLNYLLLFTEKGRCYWLRVWEIPEVAKTASGRVIQNIINLPQDDKVKAYIIVKDLTDKDFLQNNFIIFCTKLGQIKKTTLEDYSRPRISGIQAITIHEDDQLLEAKLTNGTNEILLASRNGKAIRFNERTVRPMGRTAAGVRGILLEEEQDDQVVGMICVDPNDTLSSILVLSEKGLGKRSYLDDPETGEPEYRVTNRGGKGVKTINITDKTGFLIAMKLVKEDEGLMITNKSGITIRINIKDLRIQGRATQGVKIIRLDESDSIADVAVTPPSDEEDEMMEMGEDVKVD
jgi:DNA gyrase subunit A